MGELVQSAATVSVIVVQSMADEIDVVEDVRQASSQTEDII